MHLYYYINHANYSKNKFQMFYVVLKTRHKYYVLKEQSFSHNTNEET